MSGSRQLINNFFSKNNIDINVDKYIDVVSVSSIKSEKIEPTMIENIIVDAYDGFSDEVKEISNEVSNKCGIFLGRKEKLIIKRALDYSNYSILGPVQENLPQSICLTEIVKQFRKNSEEKVRFYKSQYLKKLTDALESNDDTRVFDYVNFLHSRLIYFNEYKSRSVWEIYIENKSLIHDDFGEDVEKKLFKICQKQKQRKNYLDAIKEFNKIFYKEALENGRSLYDVVAINIDQKFYDSFKSKDKFLDYFFELIKHVYEIMRNHRTLSIKIENILDSGINIKWELYSLITIFSENFISQEENKQFYKPEELCIDFLEHKYTLVLDAYQKEKLKKYYQGELKFSELSNELDKKVSEAEIKEFKKINTGFQFTDCFVLRDEVNRPNTKEINFIKNNNELLLVFTKHQLDERKIPCPSCGSLKISGNSYPSIGVKSWECKNNFCTERSKTNRGKRYSARSNEMQSAVFSDEKENIIERELIAIWRKDIVSLKNRDSIIEMLIKYFSYSGGKILLVNFENSKKYLQKKKFACRFVDSTTWSNLLPLPECYEGTNKIFFNSEFISKFVYKKDNNSLIPDIESQEKKNYKIYNSDCLSYLKTCKKGSINHMVTSPPYYNAREYSQWKNLYNYLNDMYQICLASFDCMSSGGVFFYNIGDIFDNPNTIVKSTMGEKRIALGAYLIYLFQQTGFILLDNIIWDKGETQSNRHKNDGNFTPYYQRPANCYEHMFIFKKPGKLHLGEKKIIKSNIERISPVIKINNKGENTFGHTAPFPSEIPNMSIRTFSKEGDVVFDPFLGSGTSVWVATNLNRVGLGTELDPAYYKLAKKNIENRLNQGVQLKII